AALREKGMIRAHGVSCHSLDALKACLDNPWVQVVHARINAFGEKMDDTDPEAVAAIVKKLRDQGKGIIGMKLIGEGRFSKEPDKIDQSIRFVLGLGAVDTMIVGFEETGQVDDFAARVRRALEARTETA
ncbi:MAG: aldo/keto reductase, partial [bacterium]|nr:aldo/keto reductase [bacterium]